MIDPADRVLMVRLEFGDWTGWVLPGGGIEDGEDHRTALLRELAEETGAIEAFIGPPVWTRRMFGNFSSDYDGQTETVYLVPCHQFEVSPSLSADQLRGEGLVEHRWWTLAELGSTTAILRPSQLPELLGTILEYGAPPDPPIIDEP